MIASKFRYRQLCGVVYYSIGRNLTRHCPDISRFETAPEGRTGRPATHKALTVDNFPLYFISFTRIPHQSMPSSA